MTPVGISSFADLVELGSFLVFLFCKVNQSPYNELNLKIKLIISNLLIFWLKQLIINSPWLRIGSGIKFKDSKTSNGNLIGVQKLHSLFLHFFIWYKINK